VVEAPIDHADNDRIVNEDMSEPSAVSPV